MKRREWTCTCCGMPVAGAEYHPWIAGAAFREHRCSRTVRANLRSVVEYGMKAQRQRVSLDQAMSDIGSVLGPSKDKPKSGRKP